MLSGYLPFGGDLAEVEADIRSLNYDFDDEVWDSISDEAKDLISKMLVYEKDRITPKEVLSHPWIKNMLVDKSKINYSETLNDRFDDFKNANNLKKAILSYLATKVNDEDIKDEIELFNHFDTNKDGYISK